MAQRRRHPRITRTADLSATLRPADQPARFGTLILDMSGGRNVDRRWRPHGRRVDRDRTRGPDFRVAGKAEVVHCTGGLWACGS